MPYELRTYRVPLGEIVKAASTLARDIRKDDYGKLGGSWLTEIGPLNQVVSLSATDPSFDGASGYSSAQRSKFTYNPASTGDIYELRNHRAKGAVYWWLGALRAP